MRYAPALCVESLRTFPDGRAGFYGHSSFGCYPLIYSVTYAHGLNTCGYRIREETEYVCAECASKAFRAEPDDTDDYLDVTSIRADAHWEGPPYACDACGEDIESAYGDPDEEAEEEAEEE